MITPLPPSPWPPPAWAGAPPQSKTLDLTIALLGALSVLSRLSRRFRETATQCRDPRQDPGAGDTSPWPVFRPGGIGKNHVHWTPATRGSGPDWHSTDRRAGTRSPPHCRNLAT